MSKPITRHLPDITRADLAAGRIRLARLIADYQRSVRETTGSDIDTARAIQLIDQEIAEASKPEAWPRPLKSVAIQGPDAAGSLEANKVEIIFNGSTYDVHDYRGGIIRDGFEGCHTYRQAAELFEGYVQGARRVSRLRRQRRRRGQPVAAAAEAMALSV